MTHAIDTTIYAFVAYLVGIVGVSFFWPKNVRTKSIKVILFLISVIFVVSLSVLDFVSGVSIKDRAVAILVCGIRPDVQRCSTFSDTKQQSVNPNRDEVRVTNFTEQEVRESAISFLLGDPYGRTRAEVGNNISDIKYYEKGICGFGGNWAAEVFVPQGNVENNQAIKGNMYFDDVSGKWECWNLPFLD